MRGATASVTTDMPPQWPEEPTSARAVAKYWVWGQQIACVKIFAAAGRSFEFVARADGWFEERHTALCVPPACAPTTAVVEPPSVALLCLACAVAEGLTPLDARELARRGGCVDLFTWVAYAVDGALHTPPTVALCVHTLAHPTLTERIATFTRELARRHGFSHVERCVREQLMRVMHVSTAAEHEDVMVAVTHAQLVAAVAQNDSPVLLYPGSDGLVLSYVDHVSLVMVLLMLRSSVVEPLAVALRAGVGLAPFWCVTNDLETERRSRRAISGAVPE